MPAQGVVKIVVRQAPRDVQPSPQRPPLPPQVRPVLRVLPGPHAEQPGLRETSTERAGKAVLTILSGAFVPLASKLIQTLILRSSGCGHLYHHSG